MNKERTVIIGSGLGGLAAACTLAGRGHDVMLLEANPWLGGKAAQLEEDGFRFDMGPTILTVPRVLERVFSESGRDINDYLDLRRLDPQWRCFFEGGEVLDLLENADAMDQHLQAFGSGQDTQKGYRRFMELAERLSDISDRFFFWRALGGLRDAFNARETLKPATLRDILDLNMGRSVAKVVRSHVPDARVAQMLDHFVQYVGSSPYGSPAVLCGIAHMQLAEGVWYPIGGTRAIPEAMARLAGELGVEIRTDTEVEQVLTRDKQVSGVRTRAGETIAATSVLSNMDSVRTMTELVGGEHARRFQRRRGYEPACSGVVLYLGLSKAYEHLLHHNFVFSKDPEAEFRAIYKRGEPAPDPTCYLAATTRTESATAPPGGEALYILVHTPYLRANHNWQQMLPAYRQVILDKLKRCAGMEDIEERIVFERSLTPEGIHNRYRVLNGAIYGLASHGTFAGAFKPSNRSPDVSGLYLAGGAAHPGPGMPMAMMSGWIAADALDQDKNGKLAHSA